MTWLATFASITVLDFIFISTCQNKQWRHKRGEGVKIKIMQI